MIAQHYGRLPDGRSVELYRFGTSALEVSVITYGGRIVSLCTPDRHGLPGEVVLGYESLEQYLSDRSYLGALIGRYANRIAGARFRLDGHEYELARNDGENSLHGGRRGFDKRLWQAQVRGEALQLDYDSAAGEEGFPGSLHVSVAYTVSGNELHIDYAALSDRDTVVNLTNHTYFNLSSDPTQQVLNHELILHAGMYTPVSPSLIPTGEIRPVRDSPFDFRRRAPIGARIGDADEQVCIAGGYDHNWTVDGEMGVLRPAAEVYEPGSGRYMEVMTTEPGVQFYSGNQLAMPSPETGPSGHGYRCGFCLETQHFPDSPNHCRFPSTRLQAGESYRTSTVYRFRGVSRFMGEIFSSSPI